MIKYPVEQTRMATVGDYLSMLNDKTRVPFSWLVAAMVGVSGIVLYISDMRSRIAIQEIATAQLDERTSALEADYKQSLRSISIELEQLNDRLSGGNRK